MKDLLTTIRRRLPQPIPIGMFYPELLECELRVFEQRHGIRMPTGYRLFLKHLGNGGVGPPASGIVPLATAPSHCSPEEVAVWTELPYLARPFPFTRPWIWEPDMCSDEGTREQVEHGNLLLGEDGCGQEWHLIVTGPERGKVWWFCGEGIQPLDPGRNFIRWYLDWLEGVDDWWTGPAGAPTNE